MDKKRLSKTVFAATCLLWFSNYVYVPILSPYCESLGMSSALIGTILGVYGFVQLCLRIPIGVLSDVLKKRKAFLLLGMAADLAAALILCISAKPALVLTARALAGVAASTWSIYLMVYVSCFDSEQQAKATGTIITASLLGQFAATFLGGLIAQYADERWTFAVAAATALMGAAVTLRLPEPNIESTENVKLKNFAVLLRDRELLFYSAMAVILMMCIYTGASGFVPNILRSLGADNFTLGLSATLISLTAMLTSYTAGPVLAKKLGGKRTLCINMALLALTLILIPCAKTPAAILVLMAFTGLARGVVITLCNAKAVANTDMRLRSTAVSFFQSVYGIGITAGPVLAGAVAQKSSLDTAFLLVGAVAAAGTVMLAIKRDAEDESLKARRG